MKTIETYLSELITDLDLEYNYEEGMTYNEYQERMYDYIGEQDIIYYYKAMKYLSDNDSSLYESLSIASGLGYETESLDSELLATLLYQKELEEEFNELSYEIEEYFNEYEEYINNLELEDNE